jgi:hypothetical protein
MTIHHTQIKRAAKLDVTIEEIDGQFRATNKDGQVSDLYDDVRELLNAVAEDDVEWEDLETEETDAEGDETEEGDEDDVRGNKSGVMVKHYHDLYVSNGGGCGDTLDETLRTILVDEVEGLNVALLRAIAETNGLWTSKWIGLNPGMQRMNLANRMRSVMRNDAEKTMDLNGTVGRFGVTFRPSKKSLRKQARLTKMAEAEAAKTEAEANAKE